MKLTNETGSVSIEIPDHLPAQTVLDAFQKAAESLGCELTIELEPLYNKGKD